MNKNYFISLRRFFSRKIWFNTWKVLIGISSDIFERNKRKKIIWTFPKCFQWGDEHKRIIKGIFVHNCFVLPIYLVCIHISRLVPMFSRMYERIPLNSLFFGFINSVRFAWNSFTLYFRTESFRRNGNIINSTTKCVYAHFV